MTQELIRTSVSVEAEAIAVMIAGSAESPAADALSGLFGEVHTQAREAHCSVVVDIRSLEFATSSCLRVLANWVMEVTETSVPYKIVFISNRNHSWQRRSLGALAGASNGIVEVRTEA